MNPIRSAERVSCDASDNFVFQRSLLAYYKAAEIIGGRVLEIGTGSGYGVSILSASAEKVRHGGQVRLRAGFLEVSQRGVPPYECPAACEASKPAAWTSWCRFRS
ncbi:MAG: hypothetical protein L6V35_00385 [Alistipes putredinis]|nr:MAG: hypothetical protein L6V35_00385 [Alistipes putredinis]